MVARRPRWETLDAITGSEPGLWVARSGAFARGKRRAAGVPVVGASPSATTDYRSLAYPPRPLVLLMGQERGGLSPLLEGLCDATVRIPMAGRCDSLNLAVSVAVLLYGIAETSPR